MKDWCYHCQMAGCAICAPTIHDTATVTVARTVDGTRRRRRSTDARRRLASAVEHVKVDARIMAELVLRPGERLVIVSAEEVRTEYR